jgi:hypothetical protein
VLSVDGVADHPDLAVGPGEHLDAAHLHQSRRTSASYEKELVTKIGIAI